MNYDETSRVRLGHSGGFCLGAATVVALLPSEQLGIVVLTNAAPIGVPEATSQSFLDLVLYGEVKQDWLEVIRPAFDGLCQPEDGTATDSAVPAAQASPSLSFDAYLGTYSNDYFGDIGIVAGDGGLALQLGPRKTAFALQPQDRDVFIYHPVGENGGGLSRVTFLVGPDQRADSVVVENLDIHGEGTFTRVPPTG